MLKAILIDDEPLALHIMKKNLEELDDIEVAQTFLNPVDAIEWVKQEKIDIAFLDIEMGQMTGMEICETLSQLYPDIYIVFVTAHNHYAAEAFELNALDYLLKPVQKTRLIKTLERIKTIKELSKGSQVQNHSRQQQGMLHFFQTMSYTSPQQENITIHWRTAKAQELFAYFFHYRQKHIRKEEILDLLWPETKLENASALLHTTIYQVRKIIQEHGIDVRVKYKDEGYYLEQGAVLFDVDEWERSLDKLPPISDETVAEYNQVYALYRGDYLKECPYLWHEAEQERLRRRWLEHVQKMIGFYLSKEMFGEAMKYYAKIKEIYPYLEEGYFGLMKMNAKLGYQAEVKKHYEKLIYVFQKDLGILPSKEILDWYKAWSETSCM